jgi:GNAT superfamily N-acetyltransferase
MIEATVRAARLDRPEEVVQLIDLEAEARAALVGARGGDRWLAEHPPIGDGWPHRDAIVQVAHIGEVIVGYLVADLDGELLRIDQVWVTPEARELGFGDALLAAAIAAGRDRGARAVEGSALPGDRDTKNLYERAGIVARLITTYKRL